jgi:hypothetical protein
MPQRPPTTIKDSHVDEGEVSSEANQWEHCERALIEERSRQRWDPMYNWRWLIPCSENLARRCAWVRRSFDQKELAGTTIEREHTGGLAATVEDLLWLAMREEMEGERGIWRQGKGFIARVTRRQLDIGACAAVATYGHDEARAVRVGRAPGGGPGLLSF